MRRESFWSIDQLKFLHENLIKCQGVPTKPDLKDLDYRAGSEEVKINHRLLSAKKNLGVQAWNLGAPCQLPCNTFIFSILLWKNALVIKWKINRNNNAQFYFRRKGDEAKQCFKKKSASITF